jgi:hypothetical protein
MPVFKSGYFELLEDEEIFWVFKHREIIRHTLFKHVYKMNTWLYADDEALLLESEDELSIMAHQIRIII